MLSTMRFLCLLGLLTWPAAASAQDYPSKPIKWIVPFPAGGPADSMSRVITEKMAVLLGQPIVIETRAGAAGITGVASVAKADPDGYTIGIASSGTLAINLSLRDNMPYHPLKDLLLLTQLVSVPEMLVVADSVPARTLPELIALAKSQPGKLTYASTGVGGMPHLAAELLKLTAGIDVVHVPYTGASPAVNDLLGGHVKMMFADLPILIGNVQAGKLHALAIGSRTRSPNVPTVPTTAELGLPDVQADNWYGLVVAAATPAPIAAKLHAAVVEALRAPEVKEKLAKQGAVAVGNSTPEFTAYVTSEIEKWAKVVKAANLKTK